MSADGAGRFRSRSAGVSDGDKLILGNWCFGDCTSLVNAALALAGLGTPVLAWRLSTRR